MRPFFSYYGGKWRDAMKHYPPPEHRTIVEPFAGSAGYALRYPSLRVVLCDIDPTVVSLWRYLIQASPEEILALPDIREGETTDDLDVPPEAKALIGFWLNRAAATPRKSPSAWMRSGIRPGSFWGGRVRQTIASQVEGIRHWEVFLGDYQEIAVKGSATWFVDPPYASAGTHYRHGSEGLDFKALSEWCQSRRGQVIVCENEGAEWLPFRPLADVKTTRKGSRSREAVWLGGR